MGDNAAQDGDMTGKGEEGATAAVTLAGDDRAESSSMDTSPSWVPAVGGACATLLRGAARLLAPTPVPITGCEYCTGCTAWRPIGPTDTLGQPARCMLGVGVGAGVGEAVGTNLGTG